MLITYSKFIDKCVFSLTSFDCRINQDKIATILSLIHARFKEWNDKSFVQIKEKLRAGDKNSCRPLSTGEKFALIKDLKGYRSEKVLKNLMLHANLYQFRLDKEMRLVGEIKEDCFVSKKEGNRDLLYALFYDFEHTRHRRSRSKEKDLICIVHSKNYFK